MTVVASLMLTLLALQVAAQVPTDLGVFAREVIVAHREEDFETFASRFLPGKAPSWARTGALRSWKMYLMPPAPGFGDSPLWLVLTKDHGPEADGDKIIPIVKHGAAWALDEPMPEDVPSPFRVEHLTFDMRIEPKTQLVRVRAEFEVKGSGQSLLMRLSPKYGIREARIGDEKVPQFDSQTTLEPPILEPGPILVRAGSVFWIRGVRDGSKVTLEYAGTISGNSERAGPDACFLTAYWWPHIGRQPATHEITMTVPPDWTAIGQGEMVRERRTSREYTVTWRNDLAVCFFTVCAGPFEIAAEKMDRGRTFRSYMMRDKVDTKRGESIVEDCANAVAFFEDRLVKFPYDHYYVVDSPGYYGLEAYSFTILSPSITSWAPTHEIGHTYFGGIVPNTYIRSIWNEGLTQYIDSVLFKENRDGTLQQGTTNRFGDALSSIGGVHHRSTHEGYMRGAYVMNMLAEEMGEKEVLASLRRFCTDRRGKASDWQHLEAAVKAETGKDMGWFFRQWVYSGVKPKLTISSAKPGENGEWLVTVHQDQDPAYRLKFEIVVANESERSAGRVVMDKTEQTFRVRYRGSQPPTEVRLRTNGITLADAGEKLSLEGAQPLADSVERLVVR